MEGQGTVVIRSKEAGECLHRAPLQASEIWQERAWALHAQVLALESELESA